MTRPGPVRQPPWVPDALGRRVALRPRPRRIVSLVPSVTEALFDLGVGPHLVGRTRFCCSPAPDLAAVPVVGGPKSVDPAALLALEPDLVLANCEENDRTQVEGLLRRGVRVHVAFPRSLADTAGFLEDLGRLVGRPTAGRRAAARLRGTAARRPGRRVRAACLVWQNPYITVSGDTLTSDLMAAAGAANLFRRAPTRYPRVTLRELRAAAPELLLLPSEPYPFRVRDGLALQRALPRTRLLRLPGEWLTWYGTRTAEGLDALRAAVAAVVSPRGGSKARR